MILQEVDEGGWRQGTRSFAAAAPFAVRGSLSLIGKARRQRTCEMRLRIAGVVLVIAAVLAGQKGVPGVMIVIVPLCAKLPVRRLSLRIEQACGVVVVLEDEMDQASARGRKIAGRSAQLAEQQGAARFGDGVHGIEAQSVETIAIEPMQGILDREGAHLRDPVVDRLSPGRVRRSEEIRRVAGEMIPFRTEMIVDDVEEDH
jgi:hypothetical protein